MLVLSRRIGETVVIEGGIRLTVVSISGNKVRLGITAPEGVRVDRLEVHNRLSEFAVPATTSGPFEVDQPCLVPANDPCTTVQEHERPVSRRRKPFGKG
jgi:carbon storage regulator